MFFGLVFLVKLCIEGLLLLPIIKESSEIDRLTETGGTGKCSEDCGWVAGMEVVKQPDILHLPGASEDTEAHKTYQQIVIQREGRKN